MLSICHQLSNSQTYHWKIVVRLSNPVEFSYTDPSITIFMARNYDVWVEGETLTQITRLLTDLSEMPNKTQPSVSHFIFLALCLFLSLCLSLTVGSPPPPLWLAHLLPLFHTVSTIATLEGLLSQFTPDFPLVKTEGESPMVLTKLVESLKKCASSLRVLMI